MATSASDPSTRNDIDLGRVPWPLIRVAVVLGGMVGVGLPAAAQTTPPATCRGGRPDSAGADTRFRNKARGIADCCAAESGAVGL